MQIEARWKVPESTVYYQWVAFMLVINAAAFRIPHEIWKVLEGGMMKTFFGKREVKEKKTKEKKLATLLDLMLNSLNPFRAIRILITSVSWLVKYSI